MEGISIFWFRRDLRLQDNAGLYHALRGPFPVLPLFIFDRLILDPLEDRDDARVSFIHDAVMSLREALAGLGSSILIRQGDPLEVWRQLIEEYPVRAVYTNRDFEPYAIGRDNAVKTLLEERAIPFHTFKDQVIFEKGEVLKSDGLPYTVFTPYSRRWMEKVKSRGVGETADAHISSSFYFQSYPSESYQGNFWKTGPLPVLSLADLNFDRSNLPIPSKTVARGLIRQYESQRNFPAIAGTSRLGIHFRFGAISIREKARQASLLSEVYLRELIWRDFYSMILAHFPQVVTRSFRPEYDFIAWRNDKADFEAWKAGKTGYPIVDAGMRELEASGYMHNRVRMIVASFLTKHLLIDWRFGEAYFARKLLDFELASNNGGWQWAAGSGTDAAPYFRIFNPEAQQKKFDPAERYIRRWVPEYGTAAYPKPIVDHAFARERCLQVFREGLDRGKEALGKTLQD